jgi:hypothetical protein
LSRHGKKLTEQGALTSWRQQREELVRAWKETDRARRTHVLETAAARGRDLSGHGKKPTERGALTFWRRRRKGLVRIRKEIDRARRTHQLETAEEGTCQDTERNRPRKAHSLPRDGRGRNLSGHGKNPTERGILAGDGSGQRERIVRTQKETN